MSETVTKFKQLVEGMLHDATDQFHGGFGDGSEIERLEQGMEFIEWLEGRIKKPTCGHAKKSAFFACGSEYCVTCDVCGEVVDF